MDMGQTLKGDIRILIVDDVEVNLIILEEIIKDMGYYPLCAQSVKEALQMIQDSDQLPRVICLIFPCRKLTVFRSVQC